MKRLITTCTLSCFFFCLKGLAQQSTPQAPNASEENNVVVYDPIPLDKPVKQAPSLSATRATDPGTSTQKQVPDPVNGKKEKTMKSVPGNSKSPR